MVDTDLEQEISKTIGIAVKSKNQNAEKKEKEDKQTKKEISKLYKDLLNIYSHFLNNEQLKQELKPNRSISTEVHVFHQEPGEELTETSIRLGYNNEKQYGFFANASGEIYSAERLAKKVAEWGPSFYGGKETPENAKNKLLKNIADHL